MIVNIHMSLIDIAAGICQTCSALQRGLSCLPQRVTLEGCSLDSSALTRLRFMVSPRHWSAHCRPFCDKRGLQSHCLHSINFTTVQVDAPATVPACRAMAIYQHTTGSPCISGTRSFHFRNLYISVAVVDELLDRARGMPISGTKAMLSLRQIRLLNCYTRRS